MTAKSSHITMLICGLIFIFQSSLLAQVDILNNGTFDLNLSSWYETLPATQSTTNASCGNGHASLGNGGALWQSGTAVAGNTYLLNFEALLLDANVGWGSVNLEFYDASWNNLTNDNNSIITSTYISYSSNVVAPAGTTIWAIWVGTGSGAEMYLDCMELIETAPSSGGGSGTFSCSNGLLINPEFESGNTSWIFQSNTSISTTSYSGNSSAYANGGAGGPGQNFNASEGDVFSLSSYGKHTGSETSMIGIKFYDASWNELLASYNYFDGGNTWTEYFVSASAPANTTYVQAMGWKSTGTGETWWDAFCLEHFITTTPPSCSSNQCNLEPSYNELIWNLSLTGTSDGWLDYDNADMQICDLDNGRIQMTGNIINGRTADFGEMLEEGCGAQDGWYINLELFDRQSWLEFQGNFEIDPLSSCASNYVNFDYWNVAGTMTGLGCNSGKTVIVHSPSEGYRLQVGYGGNKNTCDFSMATWFYVTESGNSALADIYAKLDYNCYQTMLVPDESIVLEAECEARGTKWSVVNDNDASNDIAITISSGNNSTSTPPTGANDIVSIDFNIINANDYNILGRVKAPSNSANALWARVDNGDWIRWASIPVNIDWEWNQIHDSDRGDTSVIFNLLAGLHTLDIAYNEEGISFDKLYISSTNTAPSGEGTSANNCIAEICENSIDDDGDGLIDSLDPDCPIIEYCSCSGINLFDNGGFESGTYLGSSTFLAGQNGDDLGYNWSTPSGLDGWSHGPLWWIDASAVASEGDRLVYINNSVGGSVCQGQYYDLGSGIDQLSDCATYQICFDWASFNRDYPSGRSTTSRPAIDFVWYDSSDNIISVTHESLGTEVANQNWDNIIWSKISHQFSLTGPYSPPAEATSVRVNISEDSGGLDNGILIDDANLCAINTCAIEICGDLLDNDGDGDADCLDSDCKNITLNNQVVSTCIDHPIRDVATVTFDVSWINAPTNDDIYITLGNNHETIYVSDGLSSPQTVTFTVEADGTINQTIEADWINDDILCKSKIIFDAPVACSNNEIDCNILYLHGLDKPQDGEAWDRGWEQYLDEINGSNSVTSILTQNDAIGMGTYHPNNVITVVDITLTDYDLIIISPTTENHIAADLVAALKDTERGLVNINFDIFSDLGLGSGSSYKWTTDAFIDNSNEEQIYDFDNPTGYSSILGFGFHLPSAAASLWPWAGDMNNHDRAIILTYEASDVLTGVASSHGARSYIGFHMNGFYYNSANGGAFPTSSEHWFVPEFDLSLIGKELMEQAILNASSGCKIEICDNEVDDDGDGQIDCQDGDCSVPTIDNISVSAPTNCNNNGSISISATGSNIEYSIDSGDSYQSSPLFTGLVEGVYNIMARNSVTLCQGMDIAILNDTTCIDCDLLPGEISDPTISCPSDDPNPINEITSPTPLCNEVINDEFDNNTNNWYLNINDAAASATMTIDNSSQLSGANSAFFDIASATSTNWHLEVINQGHFLLASETYDLSFEAKSASSRTLQVGLQLREPPYTEYWTQIVNLTPTAQTFTFTDFDPSIDSDNVGVVFKFGDENVDFFLDNLYFGVHECNNPTIEYQWEYREAGLFGGWTAWSDIVGANGSNYDPPSINVTTQYRRKDKIVGCGVWELTNSIEVIYNPLEVDLGADETICPNEQLTISATAYGGEENIEYLWQGGETTSSISIIGSANTIYAVTVTDDNNCTATDQISITINTPPDANITGDQELTCAETTATLTATPAGQIYIWSTGATSNSISVDMTGTYSVTVTDTNGCTDTSETIVTQDITNPDVSASNDSPLTCSNTSVTLTASSTISGVTYAWSGGGTIATKIVSTPGTYTVTVTDPSNGCTATAQTIVTQNIASPVAVVSADQTICNDGSTTISASASGGSGSGYSYTWNQGLGAGASHSVTINTTTNYIVTVTDSNGCTDADNVTITVVPTPQVSIIVQDATICQGETTTITSNITGGTGTPSYQWQQSSNGNIWTNISGATTANYTAIGLNATTHYQLIVSFSGIGCTSVTSNVGIVTVESESIVISATAEQEEICLGGSTTLTANGPAANGGETDYSNWEIGTGSAGDFIRNGANSENHRINGTDPWGNLTVIWEARPGATSNADGGWNHTSFPIDHTKGYRTSVWVNRKVIGSNGRFYMGINAYGTVNGVERVTNGSTITNAYYWVSANAPTTLPEDEWVLVVGHIYPSTHTGNTNHNDSGRYELDGSKIGSVSYDYQWLPQSTTARPRTYLYYCTDTDVRQQWVYPRFDLLDGTEPSINEIINGFDVNNGLGSGATYEWFTGSCGGALIGTGETISVNPTTTTTYYVRATGNCNTSACESVTVAVNNPATAIAINDGPITCDNTEATLTATPSGLNYQWSTNENTESISVNSPGTYFVTITDSNGCSTTASTIVTQDIIPPEADAGTDQEICASDNVVLIASGGSSYVWSHNTGNTASVTVAPLSTTTYTVTVTSDNGCTDTDDITVEVNEGPTDSGTISGDQENCGSYDPGLISSTSPATGQIGLPINYNWQYRELDCNTGLWGNWSEIVGIHTEDYDCPVIITSTQYRRLAGQSGCLSWQISNTITKTVIDNQTDPGSISADQSGCDSFDPNELIGTMASGGCGSSMEYQWQQRIEGGSWTDIIGATSVNYNPATITETTEYRRLVRSGTCPYIESNTVVMTINSAEIVNTVLGSNIDCEGNCTGTIEVEVDYSITGAFNIKYTFDGTIYSLGPFSFGSNPPQPIIIEELCAGEYSDITVIANATGCSVQWPDDVQISETSAAWEHVTHIDDVSDCNDGTCDGVFVVDANLGATGPFNMSYVYEGTTLQLGPFTSAGDIIIDDLCPGAYSNITITSIESGCSDVWPDDIIINVPEFDSVISAITDDDCQINEGAITLNITNGVYPYIITWSNEDGTDTGSTTLNQHGNITIVGFKGNNTYCFEVTDSKGCTIN